MQKQCRYECVVDIFDGWMVWDLKLDVPAEHAGAVLVGLTEVEAEAFCQLLNVARAA